MRWHVAPVRPLSLVRRFASASIRTRVLVTTCLVVAAALTVMGAAGTVLLKGYLIGRADTELRTFATDAGRIHPPPGVPGRPPVPRTGSQLPSPFLVEVVSRDGRVDRVVRAPLPGREQQDSDLLRIPVTELKPTSSPFSVQSGSHVWRVVVLARSAGQLTVVGINLDNVMPVVNRLTLIELLAALGALALLIVIGSRLVAASLRPLGDIERTAVAIAGGDLSRRVRDYRVGTEVGRLSAALNTMLGHIETSQQQMRRFIADASHELRTPVTSIRGFADFYAQRGGHADRDDVDALMARIRQEAVRLAGLVDDMLLLARLDESPAPELAPVDLASLAADTVHAFGALYPDRSVTLTAGQDPVIIVADEQRIRQVIGNLLGNAGQHTPEGTPVYVTVAAEHGQARLSVADKGPGLTAEQATRVFERFYRADPSRTRASGGAGLGLSIVAALVSAHGGRTTVTTAPGQGCAFHVWLPAMSNDITHEESA